MMHKIEMEKHSHLLTLSENFQKCCRFLQRDVVFEINSKILFLAMRNLDFFYLTNIRSHTI